MIVITAPTAEPVTLAEAKSNLGILSDDSTQDALITRRIGQARAWAEHYTRRVLMSQVLEFRLHHFPVSIELPSSPLISVDSVKYIDVDGAEQTVSASEYDVDTYSDRPTVRPVYGGSWPGTRGEPHAVRVQFTAGYGTKSTDVPDLIREAILLLVGHWMNFQPQSENGLVMSRVPFAIRDILDQYRIERYSL